MLYVAAGIKVRGTVMIHIEEKSSQNNFGRGANRFWRYKGRGPQAPLENLLSMTL